MSSVVLTQVATAPPNASVAKPAPSVAGNDPIQAGESNQRVSGPTETASAVAHINQHLGQAQSDLKMHMDPASGRPVYQVIQQGTGQVLLQVPSAEVLGMSRRMRDLEGQAGGLVDKQG
ncbi:flagellar protein FlaG [Geothrix sp. PMB-07]|uniref:flagellar protein FlaG n=1 Tax=Geothrix sp. PMB-07 TaxID=3068640 RepID=UPI0027406135|nr:flagellar protein FlaG [Geothrix sp. PMB-07]WLT33550.1 flagellar protein FlaG [Geothrix sp. PMB-07]